MADTLAQSSNPVEWINKMTVILQSRVTGKNDNNTAVAVWRNND